MSTHYAPRRDVLIMGLPINALRELGLGWLFRLVVQPKLRAKRYWWSSVFVAQSVLKGVLTLRFMARAVASRST